MSCIRYLGRLWRVSGPVLCRAVLLGAVSVGWAGAAAHGQNDVAPERADRLADQAPPKALLNAAT